MGEKELSGLEKQAIAVHTELYRGCSQKRDHVGMLKHVHAIKDLGGSEAFETLLNKYFDENMDYGLVFLYGQFSDDEKWLAHELASQYDTEHSTHFKEQVSRDHRFYHMFRPFREICIERSFTHPNYPQHRGPLAQSRHKRRTHLQVLDYVVDLSVGAKGYRTQAARLLDIDNCGRKRRKREPARYMLDITRAGRNLVVAPRTRFFDDYTEASAEMLNLYNTIRGLKKRQKMHASGLIDTSWA